MVEFVTGVYVTTIPGLVMFQHDPPSARESQMV
jgi:hypothetical protein